MKLAELVIENFRGIGSVPVRIKIDNIVVLLGKNNVGKSTIISAYEAFASQGAAMQKKDFHKESSEKPITITGIFVDVQNEFAKKWIHDDDDLGYKQCVKAQYCWVAPELKGVKYSYNPELKSFVEGGMGGFDSILASRIPTPIKISPLDDPLTLQTKIIEILSEAIKNNIEQKNTGQIEGLIKQINTLAGSIHKEIEDEINKSCDLVAEELKKVFPDNNLIRIEPNVGKVDPEKLMFSGGFIRVGNEKGSLTPLSNHGTGLQRAFLWAAIKMLADTGRAIKKKAVDVSSPKVLLIEEPEAFLHPSAIKSASESLYAIAEQSNWQVIASTHSPTFVDLTKDHTTIIRIEKDDIEHFTRTFSTDSVNFSVDDRENLKMLNYCNPHFNEFFFSNNVLLVEGETEYSVIHSLIKNNRVSLAEDFHIINCFGKANIVTVSKILNHFKVNYYVIHDSDSPNAERKGSYIRNSMWTTNNLILNECRKGISKELKIKIFVSIPNFEGQYLEESSGKKKPYEAWKFFNETDDIKTNAFIEVLKCISGEIDTCKSLYTNELELYTKVIEYIMANDLSNDPKWKMDSKTEEKAV